MQVNKVKIITVLITFSVAICALIILATPPKLPLSSSNNKALVVNILKAKPQKFTPSYQAYGRIETPNILTLTVSDGSRTRMALLSGKVSAVCRVVTLCLMMRCIRP